MNTTQWGYWEWSNILTGGVLQPLKDVATHAAAEVDHAHPGQNLLVDVDRIQLGFHRRAVDDVGLDQVVENPQVEDVRQVPTGPLSLQLVIVRGCSQLLFTMGWGLYRLGLLVSGVFCGARVNRRVRWRTGFSDWLIILSFHFPLKTDNTTPKSI